VVIEPTDKGSTLIAAPGQMIDNFLPFPDEETLPLYRMVLTLACVFWGTFFNRLLIQSKIERLIMRLPRVPQTSF
jgi:hypothetical protein